MSYERLSPDLAETARKTHSKVLQRLASVGQVNVAKAIGVSESTVSRAKEQLEEFAGMLAILGLKVVAQDRVCVQEQEYLLMTRIVSRALANEASTRQLLFEEPE